MWDYREKLYVTLILLSVDILKFQIGKFAELVRDL